MLNSGNLPTRPAVGAVPAPLTRVIALREADETARRLRSYKWCTLCDHFGHIMTGAASTEHGTLVWLHENEACLRLAGGVMPSREREYHAQVAE